MSLEQSPINKEEKDEVKATSLSAIEIMGLAEAGINEKDQEEIDREQLRRSLEQILREQDSVGFLSNVSKKLGKAAAIAFAGLSLFAASGSFSNAEAGDRSFAGKIFKQVENGVIEQVKGGFRRGEQGADWRQQMGQQIEMQEYYNRRNDEQMEKQMQYQREQQAANERMQKERQREMAIQEEVKRYADDIRRAKTPEEIAMAKEKHNIIMEEIKNSSKY